MSKNRSDQRTFERLRHWGTPTEGKNVKVNRSNAPNQISAKYRFSISNTVPRDLALSKYQTRKLYRTFEFAPIISRNLTLAMSSRRCQEEFQWLSYTPQCCGCSLAVQLIYSHTWEASQSLGSITIQSAKRPLPSCPDNKYGDHTECMLWTRHLESNTMSVGTCRLHNPSLSTR